MQATPKLYAQAEIPATWEWGEHWSREGQSGYYLLVPGRGWVQVQIVPDPAFDLEYLLEQLEESS